jgi:hypothetical protein
MEGFATFMAAAFMGQRFGWDHYLDTVEAWRARLFEGPRRQSRSLARLSGLESPERRRPHTGVPKGAYVLHLLRETLGEALCDDTETAFLTCSARQSSLQRQSLRSHQLLKLCGE